MTPIMGRTELILSLFIECFMAKANEECALYGSPGFQVREGTIRFPSRSWVYAVIRLLPCGAGEQTAHRASDQFDRHDLHIMTVQ